MFVQRYEVFIYKYNINIYNITTFIQKAMNLML